MPSLASNLNAAKPSRLINNVNSLANMFSFGFGLVLFTMGLTYLTRYGYAYSLNAFSVDLVAGFYLAASLLLVTLSVLRVFFKEQKRQLGLILSLAIVLVIFVLIFFILGVIGLSMNSNDEFVYEARADLEYTARRYDSLNMDKYETKKIDW